MQLSRLKLFSLLAIVALILVPQAGLAQVELGSDSSTFGRTIHVHATGSALDNGAALIAALGSTTITGRSDPATQPVVIQLGPGPFAIGAGIVMPNYVSLRGAGIDSTTITCTGCSVVLGCTGTNNQFSHFTVESDAYTIYGEAAANVQLLHVKSTGLLNVLILGETSSMRITDSIMVTTDDAVTVGNGATINVEHSVIDGSDSFGDGIVRGGGVPNPAALNISYTFIGQAGITNPWPGPENCAYITTGPPLSAAGGCPQAPLPPAGAVQSPLYKSPF